MNGSLCFGLDLRLRKLDGKIFLKVVEYKNMSKTFTISELAEEFGISLRTLRFYEEQGLILPERDGRQRVFSRRDRVRLKLILRGKRLGLSLSDIREIIDLYGKTPNDSGQSEKLLASLQARREQLEEQRRDIDIILDEIDKLEAHCKDVLENSELEPD